MSVYRTPDERFADLPGYAFEPHYLEQDGLRMHYVDEGAGDPVLLLHGEPTWAFLYRKIIPELVGSARCVAPDYFGFGRSDKPTEPGFYTYDRHVESIARFAAELDLRNDHARRAGLGRPDRLPLRRRDPERIARLVVLNTGIGARAPSDEWLRFQGFMRRVGTEIVAGQLIRLSLVQPVTDEVIAAYDAPFPVPESRVGIVQFPELVPTSSEHPNAARMLEVREELRTFDRPGARPLLRQRPDLLAPCRRGDGGAPAERRARPARRSARATSSRRTRARRSDAGSRPSAAEADSYALPLQLLRRECIVPHATGGGRRPCGATGLRRRTPRQASR